MNFSDERSGVCLATFEHGQTDNPTRRSASRSIPHQRIGNLTSGPALGLARHRHVKRWQASSLAVAALPAKPTPWAMGAETPDGVWNSIRNTSSLETRDANREIYGTCEKLSRCQSPNHDRSGLSLGSHRRREKDFSGRIAPAGGPDLAVRIRLLEIQQWKEFPVPQCQNTGHALNQPTAPP
jgi:hypothetical protein